MLEDLSVIMILENMKCLHKHCNKVEDLAVDSGMYICSFSSKTRTSLKTQLLISVFRAFNFPSFSLPESCSLTDRFLRIVCILAFPSFMNVLILHFASHLDSTSYFWSAAFKIILFSGCQFRNGMYSESLETRTSFEVDFML